MQWNITPDGELKGCSDIESTELIIPDGVKEIADASFIDNKQIERVIIPGSVIRIEKHAFADCINLKEIIISGNVQYVEKSAFYRTPWLDDYPDDFVIVNHILLEYKGSAEEIQIPDGVTKIALSAMKNFRFIKKIIFPDSLQIIDDYAFCDCENLTEIYFPDNLKIIGERTFENCIALHKIRMPETIEEIGWRAFYNCKNLKRIPLIVTRGKILFTFPDANNRIYAKFFLNFLNSRKYDSSLLIPEVKYDFIFQVYIYKFEQQKTEAYIQKHFSDMIPVLIRLNDENLIQKLNAQFPELIKNHIDELIIEANRQEKFELQIAFMNKKYQYGDFSERNLYL